MFFYNESLPYALYGFDYADYFDHLKIKFIYYFTNIYV